MQLQRRLPKGRYNEILRILRSHEGTNIPVTVEHIPQGHGSGGRDTLISARPIF